MTNKQTDAIEAADAPMSMKERCASAIEATIPKWGAIHMKPLRDAAKIIRALSDEPTEREWRDIESAPKDYQSLLLWAVTEEEKDDAEEDGREPRYSAIVAGYSDHQPGLWWMDGTMQQVYRPTHWMPLPNPPSHLKKGKADG